MTVFMSYHQKTGQNHYYKE